MASYTTLYDYSELRRRLPDVSEVMLNHFLEKYNGNVEEVYQILKDGQHQSLPQSPENFNDLFAGTPNQHQQPSPYQGGTYAPVHSVSEHSATSSPSTTERHPLRKYPTYGPSTTSSTMEGGRGGGGGGLYQQGGQYPSPPYVDPTQSWPTPHRHNSASGVTNSFFPSGAREYGGTAPRQPPMSLGHHHNHPGGGGGGGLLLAGQQRYGEPPHSPVVGRLREETIPELQEVELQVVQRRLLEGIQGVRDEYVREVSRLRSEADNKKHKLTNLRLKVSEGTTRQDVGSLQDVITTLQYDLQVLKNRIEVERSQVELKNKKDVICDEGVRWPCKQCTFLNHPLMTRCESCDLPKEDDT